MGVNSQTLVIVGVKLSNDLITDDFYNKNEDMMVSYWNRTDRDVLRIVFDGMSGKYLISGHIITETNDDHEWFHPHQNEIDLTNVVEGKRDQIVAEIKEKFDIVVDREQVRLYLLIHHS